MPRLRTALLLITTLLFAACGDDSTSGDDSSSTDTPPVASYELTADGPECSEGAQVSRSTSAGCTVVGCTWLCAEYEGESPVDVNVKLKSCPGESWEVLSETVLDSASSTCDAYND